MSDREAFVAAIAANPADDLPRLVFADWLDENGDLERAEFIRTQIRWHNAGINERKRLDGRAGTLFSEHWRRWFCTFLNALDPSTDPERDFEIAGNALASTASLSRRDARQPNSAVVSVDVHRGFVERVDFDLDQWGERGSLAEAFRLEPPTELHCLNGLHSPVWSRFTDPSLRRVHGLSVCQLWAWGVSAPESTALLEDPHLAGVREFTLDPVVNDAGDRHPLPAPWVTRFVRSSLAYRLAGLTLRHLGDDAVPALCKPGRLQLERLELGGELNADSVRRLGESELVGGVCELRLIRASLGNTEVAALARDEWSKLRELYLCQNRITAAVLPALAAAEFLPRLKALDLSHNPLFNDTDLTGLQRLADHLDPERLERLDLTDTGLSHVPDFLAERFGDRVVV